MELYVNFQHGLYAPALDLLLAAPPLVCGNELAELRAVIAKVVYAHHIIAQKFVNAVERSAYHRCAEMAYVKGLCYVYRGVINANSLARADSVRAVAPALAEYAGDSFKRRRGAVQCKVEISRHRLNLADHSVGHKRGGKLLGNRLRRLFKLLGKAETGQRIVAHAAVCGGYYQFLCGQILKARGAYHLRYMLFVVHTYIYLKGFSLRNILY